MIYGFEVTTDRRYGLQKTKKFTSKKQALKWKNMKNEALSFPGSADVTLPSVQQNWHHTLRYVYEIKGRIPSEKQFRKKLSEYRYNVNYDEERYNYVLKHGIEIKGN